MCNGSTRENLNCWLQELRRRAEDEAAQRARHESLSAEREALLGRERARVETDLSQRIAALNNQLQTLNETNVQLQVGGENRRVGMGVSLAMH